ncbi:MAG TPA: response regulator transcription factor [Actinomycetota bacterium]|nr:response regulator transcription factor [Actinomycetota bacterium]
MSRILVVDDEPIVRDVLSRYLSRGGFAVETAGDGREAMDVFDLTEPDLVLLDLMLPHIDGMEVFSRIRSRAATPVIMLTARGEETDRVVGLEIGADDYITKPFSPREVVARVRTVLRRVPERPEREGPLAFDDLEIDPAARTVRVDGEPVALTPKEFDVLGLLASHPGTVFSRLQILEELWDFAFDGDPSTVTVHIRRLREKIEADPSRPRHLVTVWGVGYRFDP